MHASVVDNAAMPPDALALLERRLLFHAGFTLLCRPSVGSAKGWCVASSLVQSGSSCSSTGPAEQCGGNNLCFARASDEDGVDRW